MPGCPVVEQGTLPFAMTVIEKHDEVAYWRWFGLAQPTREIPPEQNMLFRVYSITKPVTLLTALLLEHQGMINLGEPAEKLVPELCSVKVLRYPAGSRKILLLWKMVPL